VGAVLKHADRQMDEQPSTISLEGSAFFWRFDVARYFVLSEPHVGLLDSRHESSKSSGSRADKCGQKDGRT
jgi:hypothetical protein